MPRALFDFFPQLADFQNGHPPLPYRPIGEFPTPIERVRQALPEIGELFIKREDLSGPLYGGNKIRRLEFLLAAEAAPEKRLLTFGGYGSNHTLATGIYGRALGYSVSAVLYPQPLLARVGSSLQAQLGAGMRLHLCRSYLHLPWQFLQAYYRGDFGPPRLITPGGTNPLGTLGWWSGGLEIAAQVQSGQAPRFDAVYVALGSGDTSAGLLLGLGAAAAELVAVRVAPWPVASATAVWNLARRTHAHLARRLGKKLPAGPRPALRVEGGFLERGYGYPTTAGNQAVQTGAALGLKLDPIYTGKAFAALLADAKSGRLVGKRVLFVNTYNGRDLSTLCAAGDWKQLPKWMQIGLATAQMM